MAWRIEATSTDVAQGDVVDLRVTDDGKVPTSGRFEWKLDGGAGDDFKLLAADGRRLASEAEKEKPEVRWSTAGLKPDSYQISVRKQGARANQGDEPLDSLLISVRASGDVGVTMARTRKPITDDVSLWAQIRRSSERIAFSNYNLFMRALLCGDLGGGDGREVERSRLAKKRFLPFNDSDAYRIVKVATEAFLEVSCDVVNGGIDLPPFSATDARLTGDRLGRDVTTSELNAAADNYFGHTGLLPYIGVLLRKLSSAGLSAKFADMTFTDAMSLREGYKSDCAAIEHKRAFPCMLELIWSYWHEEGMLVQTLGAITRRFQNVRSPGQVDPLANLEIDFLRPINNVLWGYLQDEQHRLGLMRRAYQDDHHYGISLHGQAVGRVRGADSRSKFLEAFHNLLYLCGIFYKEDDDTTIVADAFTVLNALKEVHLLLSQGAHNQFGDLPSTARQEMLIQQWILARPEFREYLPTRNSVAYPELWMDRVDAMKSLQGWTDVSVLHFRNLGMFGERVLLSVRYGNWNDVENPNQAANWARFWRQEIQGYVHAYRSVTGVDLTIEVTDPVQASARYLPPAVHLRNRLAVQHRQQLAAGGGYSDALALSMRPPVRRGLRRV